MKASLSIFFGNGCFFHQQHLFVLFEERSLLRQNHEITSLSAYGGGEEEKDGEQPLCYHNSENFRDYGQYGFAEVVSLNVPADKLFDAADVFFNDFEEVELGVFTRKDFFDVGSEYRAVIGVPGGFSGVNMFAISQANERNHKLSLQEGFGGDGDTIDNNIVWIYDSDKFPPHQAEACLQFHDDNPAYSPPYSEAYHNLTQTVDFVDTACPKNAIC